MHVLKCNSERVNSYKNDRFRSKGDFAQATKIHYFLLIYYQSVPSANVWCIFFDDHIFTKL